MRLFFAFLLFGNIVAFEFFDQWNSDPSELADETKGVISFEGETHLKNVKQLTFGGLNAEAYWSFDNKKLTYQASNGPTNKLYGTDCDQIYEFDLTTSQTTKRISTGIGATTCSFFLPDNKRRIYAGTFLKDNSTIDLPGTTCPMKRCDKNNPELKDNKELASLCNRTELYTWNVYPEYDIFLLTHELGYDGGAFFSPDGKKIVYRASRPKTDDDIALYKLLLKYDMVQPIAMEIYVMDLATKKSKQVTRLGGANWATTNESFSLATSMKPPQHLELSVFMAMINEDGTGLEQVTHAKGYFDSFPMMSYDGKQLVWGSSRNSSNYEINLFLGTFN
ncbi:CBR-TAG-10 protein [Aphelenchoides bicaudatus]|nr:CBR-TAG-10 protein [Aphelenchoides bicaudatus]